MSGPESTSREMCDACLLLIKGFEEEQSSVGKGISGSHRSHFVGSTHVSEVGCVCFEHLHREVVPREAEAGAAEAH